MRKESATIRKCHSRLSSLGLDSTVAFHSINRQVDKLRCNSVILMEQIRTIDKSRLMDRIGVLNDYEMQQVNQALGISVGLV